MILAMMHVVSELCECWFYPKEGWERICYPCYAENKQEMKKPKSPCVTIDRLVTDPRLPKVDEWTTMVMRLIRLTHPDRHGNSHESNDVTRWLLEQRQRLGKG